MRRHRPTAHELAALAAAWDLYLADGGDDAGGLDHFDGLAEAITRVLGRVPSPALEAWRADPGVSILDLPLVDREFGRPS